MRRIILVSVLLLASYAATAWAHDTWLLPTSLRVPVGESVTVSLTSGEAFPTDDFAIDPARVMRTIVRLDGSVTTLGAGRSGSTALRYVWRPTRAGIATLGVELAPKTLTPAPDKVAEYLDEIDASAGLRTAWQQMPSPKRWREFYTKHAKTFVRVGDRVRDTSWKPPLGLGLELVPRRDPTDLYAGDTLTVRVLRNGAPMPGFHVGAQAAGIRKTRFFTTDARGDARVALPLARRWLLNGTDLRRSSKPNREWDSDFTTLAIAVLPAR